MCGNPSFTEKAREKSTFVGKAPPKSRPGYGPYYDIPSKSELSFFVLGFALLWLICKNNEHLNPVFFMKLRRCLNKKFVNLVEQNIVAADRKIDCN